MNELLDTTETAERLRMHPTTLATWRTQGRGPRFLKMGQRKVLYRATDIDEWLDQNERRSTQESL
jgi:predicted DNA-binding transcriptional regulator AlpA